MSMLRPHARLLTRQAEPTSLAESGRLNLQNQAQEASECNQLPELSELPLG